MTGAEVSEFVTYFNTLIILFILYFTILPKYKVFIIQSSKKAEKRAKKQQQALFVAATREENVRLTINSRENVETSTPSTNNGKRKRGPTTLAVIRDHTPLLVEFNERSQPVGVNSEKYATFAGVAAREHVPIVIKDWRLVPSKTKEDLWSLIKVYFVFILIIIYYFNY